MRMLAVPYGEQLLPPAAVATNADVVCVEVESTPSRKQSSTSVINFG